jgi:hypothetical protein
MTVVGIAGHRRTRFAATDAVLTDNGFKIAWTEVIRPDTGKFVFPSSPVNRESGDESRDRYEPRFDMRRPR